jgi:hypothetical protein
MQKTTAFVALSILLLHSTVESQSGMWLQLIIDADRKVYEMSEWMDVVIKIKNRGREPVLFYKKLVFGHSGTFEERFLYEDGRDVRIDFASDDWALPENQYERDAKNLIRLEPQEEFQFSTSYPLFRLLKEPGAYTLKIRYLAPLDWNWHDGVRIWSNADGPLFASFRFEVTDQDR